MKIWERLLGKRTTTQLENLPSESPEPVDNTSQKYEKDVVTPDKSVKQIKKVYSEADNVGSRLNNYGDAYNYWAVNMFNDIGGFMDCL